MDWHLRPARDLGLPLADRLRSHGREPGLGGLAVQALWRRLVRGYLAGAHRLRVEGLAKLPPPPFVLVANHASHLDTLILGSVLPGPAARRAHALAAGEVFFGSIPGALFAAYAVNALPVWRRRTRAGEIAMLRERLAADGLVYILFPEGTRSRDGSMARFQPGIGTLVAGTAVPVVPCHLSGCHEAWPAGHRLPRPRPLGLRIGTPLDFAAQPNTREGWVAVAAACEAAVRALAPEPG